MFKNKKLGKENGRKKYITDNEIILALYIIKRCVRIKTYKRLWKMNKEKFDDKLWVIRKEFYLKKNFSMGIIFRKTC